MRKKSLVYSKTRRLYNYCLSLCLEHGSFQRSQILAWQPCFLISNNVMFAASMYNKFVFLKNLFGITRTEKSEDKASPFWRQDSRDKYRYLNRHSQIIFAKTTARYSGRGSKTKFKFERNYLLLYFGLFKKFSFKSQVFLLYWLPTFLKSISKRDIPTSVGRCRVDYTFYWSTTWGSLYFILFFFFIVG